MIVVLLLLSPSSPARRIRSLLSFSVYPVGCCVPLSSLSATTCVVGAGCGGHNGFAVMRTKNRRQTRLVGEVPVEVAPTRRNGRSYHCGGGAIVISSFHACVVVLKRLFE
eukprot:scaffold114447_cov34-Cyclotella_meneghiniana.AAC.2